MQPKIVTCCYCGTRAALVLKGDVRHELACSACGAPLHDLKALKANAKPRPTQSAKARLRQVPPRSGGSLRTAPPKKSARKRKSLARKFFSEAVDLIEDLFD